MPTTVKSIRNQLEWAEKDARSKYAWDHAVGALAEAQRSLKDEHGTDTWRLSSAVENIERAEAWIAYLQDPTIINKPERNLPA